MLSTESKNDLGVAMENTSRASNDSQPEKDERWQQSSQA